jgi:hypothetical protein
LDFYSANTLKQQSADRHVAPLGHIILILSQPVFAFFLNADQKLAVAAEEKAKEEKRNFVNGRHVKAVSHVPKCSFM